MELSDQLPPLITIGDVVKCAAKELCPKNKRWKIILGTCIITFIAIRTFDFFRKNET